MKSLGEALNLSAPRHRSTITGGSAVNASARRFQGLDLSHKTCCCGGLRANLCTPRDARRINNEMRRSESQNCYIIKLSGSIRRRRRARNEGFPLEKAGEKPSIGRRFLSVEGESEGRCSYFSDNTLTCEIAASQEGFTEVLLKLWIDVQLQVFVEDSSL